AYASFHFVILYAIGFIGNFGISNTLDSVPNKPTLQALMINLGLLSLFAVQHSGMARKGFKDWIKQFIPEAAERSTYVMLSNIALFTLMLFWEPIGGVIWQVESQFAVTVLISLYMSGWALVFISSFLINHFHLFGLQQVWFNFKGKVIPAGKFTTPSLYRFVRHPLYVGFIVLMWSATTMTVAHLLFAVMCTAYILVGIQFEEKDLKDELGDDYAAYQAEVPMIVPRIPKKAAKTVKSS
ncbi:MAG: methanethiol S-methyltransferase, partial [Marinicella sp.]